MDKNPLIYLDDILFSITLIEDYITNVTQEEFLDSYDIQDKVLRRLEIVAEAAKKLPVEIRSNNPQIPWKSIIGLRNIIAHTYDEVNLEEVWNIITLHLPKTKVNLEKVKTHVA